ERPRQGVASTTLGRVPAGGGRGFISLVSRVRIPPLPPASRFVFRTSYSYLLRPHPLRYPHDLLSPHDRPSLPPRRRRPVEHWRLLHQRDRRRCDFHHLLPLPLRRSPPCPRRRRSPLSEPAGYRRLDRPLRPPSRPIRGRDQGDHRRQRHLPPVHRPALRHRLRPCAPRRASAFPRCRSLRHLPRWHRRTVHRQQRIGRRRRFAVGRRQRLIFRALPYLA